MSSPPIKMYDLSRFSLSDMTRCGVQLRKLGGDAASMEQVADRVVRLLYEELRTAPGGAHACALVRLFVTLPYTDLEEGQRESVDRVLGGPPENPGMKCLTLLATAGDEPDWNSRQRSTGHKALPLSSEESVSRSPMIARLMQQLGVELATILAPDPGLVVDVSQHTFNVFHVAEAQGSPNIPAQREFVLPHAVRSVLGFGGLLPPGELFATILFSKTPIPRQSADLFKTLALNVKVALLPFAGGRVFA
jgi:hypothetical protein